ncbi:MAG: HTTM domain-containing protein [Alphaproteobacteria bacterium]|nr:HTTM domain-containing protein [Alphaproteobacteria bacterium]MBU1515991.1 HTTM domain-containing protein [Alphaproteobacteria bacterium]MBU2092794.1 HTTM domain-containing protein [Alphaproteobacteria bacterium]MBU2153681.1 HTTM domain-containing protein [Alphaproteobacteria bacterium]MBU2308309.1 HTTM domain-containing protein [Alphaproteobacteria bacterium]
MSFETAVRLTEVLLSLALIQQSLEHLRGQPAERALFLARAALCLLVILGVASPWPLVGLAMLSLLILQRFHGPYNGGSDRMGLLALWCLTLSQLMPSQAWREVVFGYLGLQLVLSYLIAGGVKIVNPDWRSGRALRDVFQFSAYPVSEHLRRWADRPRAMLAMSWAVMLFELAFPLTLLSQPVLVVGLVVAATFHLANACLFGLNRFFWTWLAVYPAILWLQDRLF